MSKKAQNISRTTIVGIVAVVGIVLVAAYLMMNPSGASTGTARTTLTLSDAFLNSSSVTAVNLTVQSIKIHSTTTGQWYTFTSPNKSYNLLALKSTSALLANANLTAGNYDEIDMSVSSVTATVNGTVKNIVLPSSNLKIFGNFNLAGTANTAANTTNWVNIDFNVNQSLHWTGNGEIILLPVIQTRVNQSAQLEVRTNGTVAVVSDGSNVEDSTVGMGVNGTMETDLVVPNNENLSIDANGTLGIVGRTR